MSSTAKDIQFYGLEKVARITLGSELYEFLQEAYNLNIDEVIVNDDEMFLTVSIAGFERMDDITHNDTFTEEEYKLADEIDDIVFSAKQADIDKLILDKTYEEGK